MKLPHKCESATFPEGESCVFERESVCRCVCVCVEVRLWVGGWALVCVWRGVGSMCGRGGVCVCVWRGVR